MIFLIIVLILFIFPVIAFCQSNFQEQPIIENAEPVTLAEVPLLADSLQRSGSDGSFVLLLFPDKIFSDGNAPGLQLSIEEGKMGIDYLLNSEFNKNEQDRFIKITSDLGCTYIHRQMNGVEYFRVEGDSLVKNFQEMLRRMYQVKDDQKIDIVMQGADYSKKN